MSIAKGSLSFVAIAAAGGYLSGACTHKFLKKFQPQRNRHNELEEGMRSLVACVLSSVSCVLGSRRLAKRLISERITNTFAIIVIECISYQVLFNRFYNKRQSYSKQVIFSGLISGYFLQFNLYKHKDLLNRLDLVIDNLLSGCENKFSAYRQSLSYLAVPIGIIAGAILTQSLINFCNNENRSLNRGSEDRRNVKHLALGVLALASSTYVYAMCD